MIDTQILIHMRARRRSIPADRAVASVSAKEFLMMYGTHVARDRYYIPTVSSAHYPFASMATAAFRRDKPFGNRATDRLLIDFNNEYPALVEFGNFAVTNAINSGRQEIFEWGLIGLDKTDRRDLKRRFRFLTSNSFRCFALEEEAIALGLDVLKKFLADNVPKANLRNTVCDTLILGTAVKHGLPLQTEDKLLAKLAAARYGARLHHEGEDLVIDFDRPSPAGAARRQESKGYINRGWRIATAQARFPV